MKKFILAMVTLFTMTVSTASAMSYEQARQQALFLTDKMAYELNLTDDQYEAAYEVNLDYLMGVNTYDDLYGAYWRQRNADLSYILLDWQYRAFLNATYFYRPLYWNGGYWHFGIYARYPRRDYFFFGRPHFYTVYRGGHSWHRNGGRSWYSGRTYGRPHPDGGPRMGMRDGFNRGDYGRGQSFGNMTRQSSTRTTVTRDRQTGNNRSFGNASRNNNRTFGNASRNNNRTFGNPSSTPNRSFGNSSRDNNRTFGTPSSTPNRSFGSGARDYNRSFGSSQSTHNRSFGSSSSSPSRSFGNSSGSSNRSFGNSSRGGSFGGNRGGSSNHGGSFGGRR